jgi:hypothetical protein
LVNSLRFCNQRGGSWWRSVPWVGAGRAVIDVAWLRRHEVQFGLYFDADVDTRDPLVATEVVPVRPIGFDKIDAGGVGQWASASVRLKLAALERMAVPHPLSRGEGSPRGRNRSVAFCYIQARHDLDVERTYLNRYRDQPKTLRLYEGGRALPVVVDGCARRGAESAGGRRLRGLQGFSEKFGSSVVSERLSRSSPRWRPFMSATRYGPDSQRYAVRALRVAFT